MDAYSICAYVFKKPEFKKKYFLSHTEKSVYYNLTDVTIKNMIKLKNDKGHMLTINAVEHKSFFDAIDNASIEQLASNNITWFDNDLTEEDIKQMFNPSYCSQNNVVNICLPSGLCDTKDIRDTRGKILSLKIQHIGMYIYADQTVNRWAAKAINIHNIEDVHLTETKENIETYWQEQVKQCDQVLDAKTLNIQEIKCKLHNQYSSIVAEKFSNKDWEYKILDLQYLIQNIIF